MREANCTLSGTGTGIVSVVLSALKSTRFGETPREGRLFATDLGRSPALLLYMTLKKPCSIRDPASLPQH